jgi:hypothetical protein
MQRGAEMIIEIVSTDELALDVQARFVSQIEA